MNLDLYCPLEPPLATCDHLNLNLLKFKIHLSVVLGIVLVFTSHIWLEATMLDNIQIEHFHHYRKFYWTALAERL